MSTPFGGPARTAPGLPNLPTPPTGWPVGSYATYAEAQRAVDYLADRDFPVARRHDRRGRPHARRARHRPAHLGPRAALRRRVGRLVRSVRRPAARACSAPGNNTLRPDPGRPGQRCAVRRGVRRGRATAPPAGGATSPRPARWWPAATTCCASRATPRRPASCWPSWRWGRATPETPQPGRDTRRRARAACARAGPGWGRMRGRDRLWDRPDRHPFRAPRLRRPRRELRPSGRRQPRLPRPPAALGPAHGPAGRRARACGCSTWAAAPARPPRRCWRSRPRPRSSPSTRRWRC